MRKKIQLTILIFACFSVFSLSCQKELGQKQQHEEQISSTAASVNAEIAPFNLEAILRGEGNRFGHIKFRQDNDAAKIITLDIWVQHLEPNREYLLQRAVDAINEVDGNCTSTAWLTLGKGLVPQSIRTDDHGKGNEALWRDITAVPTGAKFDIHFRVINAATLEVVLSSDCHQYQVR